METRKLIRWYGSGLALLAIVLLGAALRLYRIGAQSFWLDEAVSVVHAAQPAGELLRQLATTDIDPPLYGLLLHFWLHLGDSEATIRLLSALCSLATIPVLYLLGRRIGSPRLGLLAALILAVSPFHVQYAQEARMYALLTLSATLSIYFLVCLLTDPRAAADPIGAGLAGWRRRRGVATDLSWLGYVLFTAATPLVHVTALVLPLAINLFVLGGWLAVRAGPRRLAFLFTDRQSPGTWAGSARFLRNWLMAQGGVLLLLAAWVPLQLGGYARVSAAFWLPAPTPLTVLSAWWQMSSAFAPKQWPFLLAIPVLFPALAALGALSWRARPQWPLLWAVLIGSLFGAELVASLRHPVFLARTLIWASIPYYLLIAAGLLHLRRPGWAMAGLAALLLINGTSLYAYYTGYQKEPWREVAAYIAGQADAGDVILVSPPYLRTPLDFYLARHALPTPEEEISTQTIAQLPALIAGHDRVWLAYGHDSVADRRHRVPAALGQQLHLARERPFGELRVFEYVR